MDDTLYDELTYVKSGFKAVAAWGQQELGWDAAEQFERMTSLLQQEGRGAIFDTLLPTRKLVAIAVKVYRHHAPDITLWPEAQGLLTQLAPTGLFLVTDGHKIAQARKVEALGLRRWFQHCYLTSRYGRTATKPSLTCFELIRGRTNCAWSDLTYVGDNPAKDFVRLNEVGACTIRVLSGQHRDTVAAPGFDARYTIKSLHDLQPLLDELSA